MLRTLKNLFKQDREKFVVPKSVQNVIPIKTIWEDGIFLVGRNKYAKTFKFEDINYAVASREDKEAMFLEYSELLNSLDSGATTKITINNRRLNKADFEQTILIPMADDGLDKYRKEYNKMLLDKATGANSIVQDKYVTVSVCKKNIEEARNYFARVGADLIAHFNRLGSKCVELDAGDKLRISMISALHEGAWTVDEVQGTLQNLFDRQYILTEEVEVEVRYRTETDTWTDEEGNTHTDTYQVPYDYYICYVTLENFNLSHVPIYMMSEEQLSRYALYMATLGNRPDLFPQSGYVPRYTNPPPKHDVPEAYLADETFAAILEEAEKYLGFPYVWGGSSPSTSFDCSGFVSYVYNQCGWDFGRLGAQGLYNISTPTNNPKPGDLVFFTGTYDTPGVSHVGIYVGDGWMLDCGDPIHYSNLNTNYWQSHFYAYGKLY